MSSKISLIIVLISSVLTSAQEDFHIISSDRNSLVIEYKPDYSDTSIVKIADENFIKISLKRGFYPNLENWGEPAVPSVSLNAGVPSETGNTIQIINSISVYKEGKLIPKPRLENEGSYDDEKYELNENYYLYKDESDPVTFGEFGIVRGLPVQTIDIHPVKFTPAEGRILLYTSITFRIDFSSAQTYSQIPADKFIKDAVVNFEAARHWSASKTVNKITANSVLANGTWVKFLAPEDGIYKITRDMLSAYGIDPSVDPRTIKIYNNGGKMLPESVTAPVPTDLVENAILVIGEEDGVFNESDYILFYGRGVNFWDYDPSGQTISRYYNLYSNENYFWITSGGSPGKRMQNKESLNDPAASVITTTPAFVSFEEDKINLPRSGRFFFGDEFNESSRSKTYMNKLEGLVSGSPVNYSFRFINSDKLNKLLTIEENGSVIYSSSINGTNSVIFYATYQTGVATSAGAVYSQVLPDNRSVLKFTFSASGTSSKGYIDYFEIKYLRNLSAFSDQLLFFSPEQTGISEYHLNNFSNSNIRVFDISDYANVKMVSNASISGGDFQFRANEVDTLLSKYYAVGNNNFKTPSNPVQVNNSDLHGITPGGKFIIITHSNFRQQADRLKQHRESNPVLTMSTVVADIDEIYNEFSGGVRDVSGIRNFIKYAYNNWQIKPEYVLLFGDGDYDFRNIEGYGKNFIPSFQYAYTDQFDRNLNHVHTYNTDDYFVRVDGDDPRMDLAIGRITVTSPTEAENTVDKIINYELNSDKGLWRNNITLLADDGYTSTTYEGAEHTRPSENLANTYIPKSFDINKIYMASYPAEITSAGKRMPEVTRDIIKSVNEGTLIFNYIGHGSPEVWAHEVVFEKSQTIPQFTNSNYFFLTAATCDFAYFDNPASQSGAEDLILKPGSGAIAVYSATRAVFSGLNHELIYSFFTNLLQSSRDTLDLPIPIGKANFLTKQTAHSVNDQKYHILGDPTLRLVMPRYRAEIDTVNGQPSTVTAQIKALSNTSISGEIRRSDSTLWNDYNGEGLLTVYDSERDVHLQQIDYDVTYQGGVIFKGRVSVVNGDFSAGFVVPKDISYENKNGKILLYFYDPVSDGLGYDENIIVGGTDTTAVNDGKGPQIEIYFNNTTSGNYLVDPNATLIVKLEDETGLNTTGSGIGHRLEGILNEDENNPLDFSKYFTGNLNAGGRSGEINYRFNDLQEGEYKIEVKAWDVFNNFSKESSNFTVTSGSDLVVRDVYNYPNPFSSSTTFTFQQNLASPIDFKIKIYTVAGRMIREIERYGYSGGFVTTDWDGTDSDGNLVANGTYLYKIIINSIDGQFNKSVIGKLAVIR